MTLKRIISGGQTGVDRAALDAARRYPGMGWGGWCPAGRLAEDGAIPDEYFNQGKNGLKETKSDRYVVRTAYNVRDSDATLCVRLNKMTRGTQRTVLECRIQEKQYWICDPYSTWTKKKTAKWICENRIMTLNVAGPRHTNSRGIYDAMLQYMSDVIYFVWLFDFKSIKIWEIA